MPTLEGLGGKWDSKWNSKWNSKRISKWISKWKSRITLGNNLQAGKRKETQDTPPPQKMEAQGIQNPTSKPDHRSERGKTPRDRQFRRHVIEQRSHHAKIPLPGQQCRHARTTITSLSPNKREYHRIKDAAKPAKHSTKDHHHPKDPSANHQGLSTKAPCRRG